MTSMADSTQIKDIFREVDKIFYDTARGLGGYVEQFR